MSTWDFVEDETDELPEDCYTGYEVACIDPEDLAQVEEKSEWYETTRVATIIMGSYSFLSSAISFVIWFVVYDQAISFKSLDKVAFFAWFIIYQLLWTPLAILFVIV